LRQQPGLFDQVNDRQADQFNCIHNSEVGSTRSMSSGLAGTVPPGLLLWVPCDLTRYGCQRHARALSRRCVPCKLHDGWHESRAICTIRSDRWAAAERCRKRASDPTAIAWGRIRKSGPAPAKAISD
jgi:hypothetical protein